MNRTVLKFVFSLLMIWVLFIFCTYSLKAFFHFVPLVIFALQIGFGIFSKSKGIILSCFLNPIFVFFVFYSSKASVNYLNEKPTILKCTYYIKSEPSFDKETNVYLEYFDDDCDWGGLYKYTIDINNAMTNKLVERFGNPL